MKDASNHLYVPGPRGSSTVAAGSAEGQVTSLVSVALPVGVTDVDLTVGVTDIDLVSALDEQPAELPMSTTVLLAPDEHRALTQWCGQAARELGRPSLACHEVLQGLVARLVADPRLAADIVADFRERAGIAEIQRFAAW